jgi:hypothetical protein
MMTARGVKDMRGSPPDFGRRVVRVIQDEEAAP